MHIIIKLDWQYGVLILNQWETGKVDIPLL